MVFVKMKQETQFWLTVSAAVGLVLAVTETRVQHGKAPINDQLDTVSTLAPEESMAASRSHHLVSQPIGRNWIPGNIYSGHYQQEFSPDSTGTYWTRRADKRYHSQGGAAERNLHRGRAEVARHESREPQPRQVYTTNFPAERGSVWDPSSASRMRISADGRFISHVHQEDSEANANDHRHGSHEERLSLIPRREVPRRSLPDRPIENQYRASYDDSRDGYIPSAPEQEYSTALANLSGSGGRPLHYSRHRVHGTHTRLRSTTLSVATTTRGSVEAAGIHRGAESNLSEISNEVESNARQRQGQPDLCCGSKVPFDSRAALVTGPFERVASAGSIKVVKVPDQQSSFPPNKVRDLRVTPLDPHTLSLTWTAPGDDLDSGTASGYIIRLSEVRHELLESQFDAAPEETLLGTSETLAAAGVYQIAGTQVGVEIPVGRQLQRGYVYYVALKAVDNDGHSSGVSNVARFSLPESLSDDNTAPSHDTTSENYAWQNSYYEEVSDSSSSQGTVQTHREITILPERSPFTLPTSSPNIMEAENESHSNTNSEVQSLQSTSPPSEPDPSESDGFEKQRKRKGKKCSKRKKNKKSKRRRKGGRRNGTRDSEHRMEDRATYAQDSEVCEPSVQEQSKPVSLCEARYSLTLAITYFTQSNELQFLDYLSAALHTLDQKMQPSWREMLRAASPEE